MTILYGKSSCDHFVGKIQLWPFSMVNSVINWAHQNWSVTGAWHEDRFSRRPKLTLGELLGPRKGRKSIPLTLKRPKTYVWTPPTDMKKKYYRRNLAWHDVTKRSGRPDACRHGVIVMGNLRLQKSKLFKLHQSILFLELLLGAHPRPPASRANVLNITQ